MHPSFAPLPLYSLDHVSHLILSHIQKLDNIARARSAISDFLALFKSQPLPFYH